ncbi:hypothetical protein B0H11DRAFT_1743513, partial [Mycena galericulata]
TARIVAQFMDRVPYLTSKILESDEADASMGSPCACGTPTAVREVKCFNCSQAEPSCKSCFVAAHLNNPFHWAEVWDLDLGCFVRHTISALGAPFQLGHHGKPCGNAPPPMGFKITAETGIHALQIQFCGHWGTEGRPTLDRVDQLMDARLFPCTFAEPKSAITFNALKQFQIHHLEGKGAAFDYCGALRRLSDNSFTASVPDMYENFIRCSRMWSFLTTRKRLGQEHGINKFLPYRPPGNMMLYCPSCPEPGFNMDKRLLALPSHLRHLNQERQTADGNFHCNKSTKNSDPLDYSLYRGSTFFPTNEVLNDHLKRAPKSTCNYLKAVNNQDKKKFKNMEITGIVNVQCSHVFIKASVDLQFGERYANVDLALARAIRQKLAQKHEGEVTFVFDFEEWLKEEASIDRRASYDAACQYSVNLVSRFKVHSPDLVYIVEKLQWSVPALHIQGHQEECMYKFGTSYMVATGHFHGETAEFYWPELNQIGTQVSQQSGGHRQDTIINHHNDWNYKKMAKAFSLLINELRTADAKFQKHQRNFLGLSATYAVRIESEGWMKLSREPDTSNPKYTKSVYRYSKTKVPTQTAVYERMLSDEAAVVANTNVRLNLAGAFLNEGIRIQQDQLKTKKLVAHCKNHFSMALKNEIDEMREEIEKAIVQWRKEQKALKPWIEDRLNQEKACAVENELLGLPSDFDEEERQVLGIQAFVRQESDLREGAAFDSLAIVKLVAKAFRSMRDRKRKNDTGVYKNTMSQKQLNDTERRRDLHIADYMAARTALIKLDERDGAVKDQFPPLTVEDTLMKSRTLRRQLGDSGKVDGPIWAQGAISVGARGLLPPATKGAGSSTKGLASSTADGWGVKVTGGTDDGWLWTFKPGKMTEEEVRSWNMEGDRIQWFRAEAEMERWREQVEMKLAELRTTIRSFAAYKRIWTQLALEQDATQIGHIAYAKQKAHMFGLQEAEGRGALENDKTLGPKYGCIVDDEFDLLAFIQQNRAEDTALFDAVLAKAKEVAAVEKAEALKEAEGRVVALTSAWKAAKAKGDKDALRTALAKAEALKKDLVSGGPEPAEDAWETDEEEEEEVIGEEESEDDDDDDEGEEDEESEGEGTPDRMDGEGFTN